MKPAIRNRVLLVMSAIAVAATLLGGFVTQAPNRLVSGVPIALWQAAPPPLAGFVFATLAVFFVIAFAAPRRILHWIEAALALGLILITLSAASQAASALARIGSAVSRTSLGAAFWILIACAGLAMVDALQRMKAGPAVKLYVAATAALAVALLIAAGDFGALSIAKEYAQQRAAFSAELGRHIVLVVTAIGFALAIGIPLGIALARRPRSRGPAFAVLNLVQTIPSLALFGLLIGPLSYLGAAVPALGAIGVNGIGFVPASIALVLYSLLPVVRNTDTGIRGISPGIVESAVGTGMTPRQILWKVELPLAAPVLLAGVRIVLVQAIGLAVVAALIGAGGLGTFVFQGLGQYATDLVLLGAVPTILMALTADFLLRLATEILSRGPRA